MESPKRSIVLQLASSCWFHFIFICFLHALYRLNSLVQQIANYAYALLSTICMHIFRGSLVYIMRESNFVIHFSLYTKDHEIWPSLVLLMSSFLVFDAKGGEFEGPKASIKLMSTSGNGPRKGGKWIMDWTLLCNKLLIMHMLCFLPYVCIYLEGA